MGPRSGSESSFRLAEFPGSGAGPASFGQALGMEVMVSAPEASHGWWNLMQINAKRLSFAEAMQIEQCGGRLVRCWNYREQVPR